MKKLICHLLIVWMALFAGGANAHGISGSALGADHAGHSHNSPVESSIESSPDQANAEQTSADSVKTCSQSHCGHGHSTGMLMSANSCVKTDASADAPFFNIRWASAAITDNIERPKWPTTTPAVVSLLS